MEIGKHIYSEPFFTQKIIEPPQNLCLCALYSHVVRVYLHLYKYFIYICIHHILIIIEIKTEELETYGDSSIIY